MMYHFWSCPKQEPVTKSSGFAGKDDAIPDLTLQLFFLPCTSPLRLREEASRTFKDDDVGTGFLLSFEDPKGYSLDSLRVFSSGKRSTSGRSCDLNPSSQNNTYHQASKCSSSPAQERLVWLCTPNTTSRSQRKNGESCAISVTIFQADAYTGGKCYTLMPFLQVEWPK